MDAAERLTALPEIEAAIWHQLASAALDRDHEWRSPVLATVHDGRPDARTVILREVDAGARRLAIYSDARAAKVAQVQAQPMAVLVCWSPRLGWQLRLQLAVAIETDRLALAARWSRIERSAGADDYRSAAAPGMPLPDPRVMPATNATEHFAVLHAQVLAIDWLELHRGGHRRAVFDAAGAHWAQP